MLKKLSITDLDIKSKRVFIRVDFNVPLDENQQITDDTRIVASLPTIEHALKHGAKVILASHLGRPKGKIIPELSLKPVAIRLGELLDTRIQMAPDCVGSGVEMLARMLGDGQILLLENLRYHKEETDNDREFARSLSELCDVFVNDAFGTAHRAHASTEGITHFVDDCAAGFLLHKEIEYFDNVLINPERPYVAILGGAKISTKIPVIENLLGKVDSILIGGGMMFTFFKAMGLEIGRSLVEDDMVKKAAGFLEIADSDGYSLLLPHDILIADEFGNEANRKKVSKDRIEPGWMGLDIGDETIKSWCNLLSTAKIVLWNGPMGAFELPNFAKGTIEIARALADSKATSIVGGGDSVAALEIANVKDRISHVSTGGGASLDFMAGKKLPGIEALTDK